MGWFKIVKTDLEWSEHLKQHVFLLKVFKAKEFEIDGGIVFYFNELPEPFAKHRDEWFETDLSFDELKKLAKEVGL